MTTITDQVELTIRGLYDTAFDRTPDTAGLAYWYMAYSTGEVSLIDMTRAFVASKEFEDKYRGETTREIIEDFYHTSFNRTPASTEVDWWAQWMIEGHTVSDLLVAFATSEEQRSGLTSGHDENWIDPTIPTSPQEPPHTDPPPEKNGGHVVTDIPTAANDHFTMQEDAQSNFAGMPMANDVDELGHPLTGIIRVTPDHGTAVIDERGRLYFTPDKDFAGTVTLKYVAYDGHAESNLATVTIDVLPINDAPVITAPDHIATSNWQGYLAGSGGAPAYGQTFIAGSETAGALVIAAAGSFHVSIVDMNNGTIGQTLFQSDQMSVSPTIGGAPPQTTIDISSVHFTPGSTYAFLVEFADGQSYYLSESDDFYAAGQSFFGNPPFPYSFSDFDISFDLNFVDRETAAISQHVTAIGNVTVSDVDDTHLEGASVTIDAGHAAGDALYFANTAAITGHFDPTTGVLSLSGHASISAYETALESVEFSGATAGTRVLDFAVSDGDTQVSLVGAAVIDVT